MRTTAEVLAAPQEASLEELGVIIEHCACMYIRTTAPEDREWQAKARTLVDELTRRDALAADYKAALEMACHNIGENGCSADDYLRYVAAEREGKEAQHGS
jgi:hypothetical protein